MTMLIASAYVCPIQFLHTPKYSSLYSIFSLWIRNVCHPYSYGSRFIHPQIHHWYAPGTLRSKSAGIFPSPSTDSNTCWSYQRQWGAYIAVTLLVFNDIFIAIALIYSLIGSKTNLSWWVTHSYTRSRKGDSSLSGRIRAWSCSVHTSSTLVLSLRKHRTAFLLHSPDQISKGVWYDITNLCTIQS